MNLSPEVLSKIELPLQWSLFAPEKGINTLCNDFGTVQQSRTIKLSCTLALNVFLCILSNYNCHCWHCLFEAEELVHSRQDGGDIVFCLFVVCLVQYKRCYVSVKLDGNIFFVFWCLFELYVATSHLLIMLKVIDVFVN